MMPRFFTLQQAEKVLPDVASAIREAISLKVQYERMESERESFSQRVAIMGGVRVDRGRLMEQKDSQEAAAQALRQAVEKVHQFGCLVKDLDIGLIDFPTLFQGEEVYLCWKLGEAGIQFWHGVDEGFRGRKPIDAGFLEHHRGELPN
jgi:hypothetical protein